MIKNGVCMVINYTLEELSNLYCNIENVEYIEGKVRITSGNITDIAYETGNIKGIPSLYILDKVDDAGYRVVNHIGMTEYIKNDELIELCKNYNLINGKIVNREGKRYISAIKGNFNVLNIKRGSNSSKYKGEFIRESSLRGFAVCEGKSFNNNIHTKAYDLYSVRLGTGLIEHLVTSNLINWSGEIEIKDGMHSINGVGFLNSLMVLNTINNDEDLENFLELDGAMRRVKNEINRVDKFIRNLGEDNKNYEQDQDTKIVKMFPYNCIIGDIYLDKDTDKININEKLIDKYKKLVKDMRCATVTRVNVKTKSRAILGRKCETGGIKYRVIDLGQKGNSRDKLWRLEDIFKEAETFANVKVLDSNNIEVYGLDGVYRYNIDKLYDEYKNYELEYTSNRKIKAKLIDSIALENINAKGELTEFRSSLENVIIPKECSRIQNGSITITENNKRLVIGENVRSVGTKAFKMDREDSHISFRNLKEIEVKCSTSSLYGVMKSLNSVSRYRLNTIKIKFNRDITPEDLIIKHIIKSVYRVKFEYEGNNNVDIMKITDKERKLIVKNFGLRSTDTEKGMQRLDMLELYINRHESELKADGLFNVFKDIANKYRIEIENKCNITYGGSNS